MTTMKIETNETPKAFRVNGVTIAKKHLNTVFAGDIKDETRLHMLLATVPSMYLSGAAEFIIGIAEKREKKRRALDSVSYAARKVLRLWTALGLTPGIADAFANVAKQLAGPDAQRYAAKMGVEVKARLAELEEKLGADFTGDSDGNIIPFPKKPVLH